MNHKNLLSILIAILVTSALVLTFHVQPAKAFVNITIEEDGSIVPNNGLITTSDLVTYVFTADIVGSIMILRNNIVLDGMGHMLSSPSATGNGITIGWGVSAINATNGVIIQNLLVMGFANGIYISSYDRGVNVINCRVEANSDDGVVVDSNCLKTVINYSFLTDNGNDGIFVNTNASYTTIDRSVVTSNTWAGVEVRDQCVYTTISTCNVSQNGHYGISEWMSSNNVIEDNIISATNTFWPGGFGYAAGVVLIYTSDSWVDENNITDNGVGIGLNLTTSTLVWHNNFVNNLVQADVNPWKEAWWFKPYPMCGNYWSDYTGHDLYNGPEQNVWGSDGVGDSGTGGPIPGSLHPYVINSANQDNYSFMNESGWLTHPVSLQANVTVTSVDATPTSLSFTAQGTHPDTGYINASIPVGLNSTDIVAEIDGVPCNLVPSVLPYQIITTNGTFYFVAVFFQCSAHLVIVLWAVADVAVTGEVADKTVVGRGYILRVNETVENFGTLDETFTVSAYANATSFNDTQVTLGLGNNAEIDATWNTTGVAYGFYNISSYAWPVPYEANVVNNNATAGMIYVSIPGDVNGDGQVNILDAILMSNAFATAPGNTKWNPNADINCDNSIDILDAILIANHFLNRVP